MHSIKQQSIRSIPHHPQRELYVWKVEECCIGKYVHFLDPKIVSNLKQNFRNQTATPLVSNIHDQTHFAKNVNLKNVHNYLKQTKKSM